MSHQPEIERFGDNSLEVLDALVEESRAEGYRMLVRLVDEWRDGTNRFSHSGEALFVARFQDRIAGVCGLNMEPYIRDPNLGRLRHLYVAAKLRRHGIGRCLVNRIIAESASTFTRLTLRTNTEEAAAFYAAVGFSKAEPANEYVTHFIDLAGR